MRRLVLVLSCLAPGLTLPARGQVAEVAVERRLADALGLRPGDTVTLGLHPDSTAAPAVVAAVYQPARDPAAVSRREWSMRMHLPDLERLLGRPDRIDRIGVGLLEGVAPDSAARALNRLAFGFRAHPSAEIASGSSQTFRVVSRFHRAIAVISILASAVFLLCIMLLKVEERRHDIAMMRFIGVRRRTIFLALCLEAAALAALGSLLGVGLAWVAGGLTNLYYQRFFDTTLVFSVITPDIVGLSVGLSLVLGLVAGAAAAARLARRRPMELWGR